jgi:hypothetical protein
MTFIYRAPQGYVTVDPSLVHDGKQWHLFYVTGRIAFADIWIDAIRRGDFTSAAAHPYEEGEGHAVGERLFTLRYQNAMLTEPQGEFALGLQGDSAIVRHGNRWVDLYTTRGPEGQAMCLAYSEDLNAWRLDPRNPILRAPAYALPRGKCGGAFILPYAGRYLIYYMLSAPGGLGGVALCSTDDFERYDDHGFVFLAPLQARGTRTVESPCVVYRDGLWHLFYGLGTGVWHVVSNRPDCFMADHHFLAASSISSYCLGPFHACRVYQDLDGRWFMISTPKEERRRQNRENGVITFRGSMQDESIMLEGVYICRVEWDNDYPVLTKWVDSYA